MPSTSTTILGITLTSPGNIHFIGSQRPFETRSNNVAINLLSHLCHQNFLFISCLFKMEILRYVTIRAIHNKIVNTEAI